MCTVYLWIGFAVNLARFLVPHYSYFTVAAREKNFASSQHLHPLILQRLKMRQVSAKVGTCKGRDWNTPWATWVHPRPVCGVVGTILIWYRPEHSCPSRTWPCIQPGKASRRICRLFGRKCVAEPFMMEQVIAGRSHLWCFNVIIDA